MQVDRILGDRVLIAPIASSNITKSGIVLPDKAAHLQPKHGVVRGVGLLLTPQGHYKHCLRVEVGEIVLLPPKGGLEIDADGERLVVYDSGDVLAVVKEDGCVGKDGTG